MKPGCGCSSTARSRWSPSTSRCCAAAWRRWAGSAAPARRRAPRLARALGTSSKKVVVVHSERDKWGQHSWGHCKFHVFRQRDFLGTPVNILFIPPKSARVYLFPQSVKIHYFCSGPTSVDPICVRNQFMWEIGIPIEPACCFLFGNDPGWKEASRVSEWGAGGRSTRRGAEVFHAALLLLRKGGWNDWKPSSSSSFSIRAFRAFRACPLVETRQTAPCRTIRGKSSDSRQQYLSQQYPPQLLLLVWFYSSLWAISAASQHCSATPHLRAPPQSSIWKCSPPPDLNSGLWNRKRGDD